MTVPNFLLVVIPLLLLGLFFLVRPHLSRMLNPINEQISHRVLASELVETGVCLVRQSSLSGLFPPLLECKMALTAIVTENGLTVKAMTGDWTVVRVQHSDIESVQLLPRREGDQWLQIHLENGSQFMLGGVSLKELQQAIESSKRH